MGRASFFLINILFYFLKHHHRLIVYPKTQKAREKNDDLARKHDCRVVLEVKTADGLRRLVNWLESEGLFIVEELSFVY